MGAAVRLAGLLGLACAGVAGADGPLSKQECVGLLNDGLRAYDRGTELAKNSPADAAEAFREAADAFQRIVDSGVHNGRLYYNLGNARLRCGRLGRAIANYLRARQLTPTDARLKENLGYARSLCPYDIPERTERALVRILFFWHYETSLRLRFVAGLIAYLVFWVLLIGRTFTIRFAGRSLAGLCLLAWVALGASVIIDLRAASAPGEGVVTAEEVVVRKGNGEGYDPQFEQPLTDGVEFELLEQRDEWLHIRLPDGQEGWIPLADAELICREKGGGSDHSAAGGTPG
jgi:hypothetical protein